MKKKTDSKMVKMILWNDREVVVNLDKVCYATPEFVEETGQELLKIMFTDGREIDVIDKFNEFMQKVDEVGY